MGSTTMQDTIPNQERSRSRQISKVEGTLCFLALLTVAFGIADCARMMWIFKG